MERMITLTTDFGLKDPYAGAMKGALLCVNPSARVFDITHLVERGDVIEGAFVLAGACAFWPRGTIHIGVVDPGVGGPRRPILIETERYFFVGPDNGLFSLALEREEIRSVIHLTETRYFLEEVSPTFHGRDIFAPVAGRLSLGAPPSSFGSVIAPEELVPLTFPIPEEKNGVVSGEVVYVDNFGNLITNIGKEFFEERNPEDVEVSVKGVSLKGLRAFYFAAGEGEPLCLIGSSGRLEVAVSKGSAMRLLDAGKGEKVVVRFP